ncbi:hypothetical protein [Streptomyces sp. NPDC097619]|uniref:hypothetical protein n=1 Tax=Streptomyces sp. NPDC097619 TaxID=3157228 RepID=UPI0033300FCD
MRTSLLVGDKARFAAEVGAPGPLCRVDLWAAGRWLTCDDNMVYTPAFRREVLAAAAWLRSGAGLPVPFSGLSAEAAHRRLVPRPGHDGDDGDAGGAGAELGDALRGRYRALLWGPTTDNLIAHLFREEAREKAREEDRLTITLEFWREDHLREHPEDAGTVFVAELPVEELLTVLDAVATALGAGTG